MNGDVDLSAGNTTVTVVNGLVLNGTATLGDLSRMYFNGTQTLGGTGTVVFNDGTRQALVANTNNMTLTIGAGDDDPRRQRSGWRHGLRRS